MSGIEQVCPCGSPSYTHLPSQHGPACYPPAPSPGVVETAAPLEGGLIDVELLHAPRLIHPLTDAGTLDESVVLHTYCDECTPDATVSMIEDAEWDEDWPIVEHPCRTVTFIRRALLAASVPTRTDSSKESVGRELEGSRSGDQGGETDGE